MIVVERRVVERRVVVAAVACLATVLVVASGCSKKPAETARATDAAGGHDSAARDPNRLWCAEHRAYEDECFICHAELREAGRLWCAEHARYEDRCWLCHPELEDKNRLYCVEHSLYEDECFLCHPELKQKTQVTSTAGTSALMCTEHGLPEDQCGICHPDLVAAADPEHAMKVRLPSADSARKAGIETAAPGETRAAEGIDVYGEVAFNQNRLAHVVAPVGGIVRSVDADLGDRVGERQVVARLWSATISDAVATLVLARQALTREQKLSAERLSPARDLEEAEVAYHAASQHLQTLGFDAGRVDELSQGTREDALLELRAPLGGEVVARAAVRGEMVEAGAALFTVADRRNVWVELDIPEAALPRIEAGQDVELTIESLPGRVFQGTLTWVSAEVDDRTRMARARAEVPDVRGELKAAMFARARILTSDASAAMVIPESAVQRVGGTPVVFVQLENDLFDARPVRLGSRVDGGDRVVLAGLRFGEPVVVAGSYAVKSHLLVTRLGAGCCEVD